MVPPKQGVLVTAAENGFPYAHPGCHVCHHPRRAYIELLIRAKCSSRSVRRKLLDLGVWAPTWQSINSHARRHLVPVKLLDQIAAAEHAIRASAVPAR
jgi:hypothetical protein